MSTVQLQISKKLQYMLLLALLVFPTPIFSIIPNVSILSQGDKCVNLVLQEKFAEAHKVATSMIKSSPKSAAGYFFRSAVYFYEMSYTHNFSNEQKLYDACEKAVYLGDQNYKRGDSWGGFFKAATLGVRGSYERERNRLVTSLKLGWQAVEIFKTLLKIDSDLVDASYGVAIYDYWVGANKRLLWWMPGVEDNRVEAIATLETVINTGSFTKKIVLFDLMIIYNNEAILDKAEEISDMVIANSSKNAAALILKGDISIKKGRYQNANIAISNLASVSRPPYINKKIEKLKKDLKKVTK
jgi:tetratricopeptide (TPR) repeat protein